MDVNCILMYKHLDLTDAFHDTDHMKECYHVLYFELSLEDSKVFAHISISVSSSNPMASYGILRCEAVSLDLMI